MNPSAWQGARVAVFRLGALGDVLAAVPALAVLRRLGPREIVLAGRGEVLRVVRGAGLADAVWDLDGAWAAPLFGGTPAVPPEEAGRPFPDRVVMLGHDDPGLRTACRAAGAAWICTGTAPPGRRAAEYHASPWGAPDLRCPWLRRWALDLSPPAGAADAFVVHPGSGSKSRNWPPDRWVGLLRALGAGKNGPAVVVEGPADAEEAAVVEAGLAGRVLRLANQPLHAVAATVARARLFLGNDSGIAHLAGLAGAPCVVVFGPSDPREWLPAGPRVAAASPAAGPGPVDGVAHASVVRAARSLRDPAATA